MRILKIKGHGKNWCHGECLWTEELCVKESSVEVNKSLPVSKREEGPSGVAESSGGDAESPPATSVNCGAHLASSCEECPQVMLIDGNQR